jgi:hypothetical protein
MNAFRAACDIYAAGGDTKLVCCTRRADRRGSNSAATSSHWVSWYETLSSSVLSSSQSYVIAGNGDGLPFGWGARYVNCSFGVTNTFI